MSQSVGEDVEGRFCLNNCIGVVRTSLFRIRGDFSRSMRERHRAAQPRLCLARCGVRVRVRVGVRLMGWVYARTLIQPERYDA